MVRQNPEYGRLNQIQLQAVFYAISISDIYLPYKIKSAPITETEESNFSFHFLGVKQRKSLLSILKIIVLYRVR